MEHLNAMYLRRAGRVIPPMMAVKPEYVTPTPWLTTAAVNLSLLGFRFSPELLDALAHSDRNAFLEWFDAVETMAREAVMTRHGNIPAPLYPDFPQQVMDASDAELLLNAMMHYLGDAIKMRILPLGNRGTIRRSLLALPTAKPIDCGTYAHLDDTLTQVITAPLGWGDTEKEDVTLIHRYRRDLTLSVVPQLHHRENRATLWALAWHHHDRELADLISSSCDSATDALRLAAAYAGFSAALPPIETITVYSRSQRGSVPETEDRHRIRFGTIPSAIRRQLLAIVDRDQHAEMQLAQRPGLWKTLGERIHPGDYATKYPNAYAAFTALRRGTAARRNTGIERAIAQGDIPAALTELQGRPGELVRRLDAILRRCTTPADSAAVIRAVETDGHQVSTHVLWQAWAHFTHRHELEIRAVIPKSPTAFLTLVPPASALQADVVAAASAALRTAISRSYATRPPLSGTWTIDPQLYRITIPATLRNTTTGFDVIGRGSRVALPLLDGEPATTVRLFCHWRDLDDSRAPNDSRVDIDLSGVLYDHDLTQMGRIWYGNLRSHGSAHAHRCSVHSHDQDSGNEGLTHSGDITSAPEGAAEYIDADVATLRERGVRYLAISVICFTGQQFTDIPELFAGVQVRRGDPQRGEVFDARTVATKFAINAPGRSIVPLLIDLETLELVWVDMNIHRKARFAGLNITHTAAGEKDVLQGVLCLTAPTVGDVIEANLVARGGDLVAWTHATADVDTIVARTENGLSIPMAEILADWLP